MRDSQWLPWYRIAWNLVWIVPVYTFRIGYVVCIFIMLGPQDAGRAWDATA